MPHRKLEVVRDHGGAVILLFTFPPNRPGLMRCRRTLRENILGVSSGSAHVLSISVRFEMR